MRSIDRTILVSSLALWIALCGPALCGLVYTADDLGAFHLPLRAFYARALESGDAFDWCPDLYGGFYLTGEGQVGTYHPLHLLLYKSLPLAWAWNIECLVSYPLLFAGVWLLLRHRGFTQAESLFGAAVFTFCGFNLLHFVHVNAIAVVAHIPWLLYAIGRVMARRTEGVCLVAALTGSQLLLGYPQYVIYSLVAEALYLGIVLREHCVAAGGHRLRRSMPAIKSGVTGLGTRLGALWAAAKLIGLCLAAVQVFPTIEALRDSVREGVDSSFSASGSLHPLNVIQLVAPYLFTTRVVGQNTHELSFYVGIVPLLLSIVAVARRQSERESPTIRSFALLLIVLGGLLALGEHGPLHELLARLPVLGYFRFPCRAIVLFDLGIGLLAAAGFAAIYRAHHRNQSLELPRKTFGLVTLAGLIATVAGPMLWPEHATADWRVWYGPIALVLAIPLLTTAVKGKRLALHALVVLAAIDLGAYGLSYAVYRDACPLADYIASAPAPSIQRPARVALDLAQPNGDASRAGNQILLRGLARIDGYAGLEPARRLDYRQPAALRAAGAAAVAAEAPVARDQSLQSAGEVWLYLTNPLPRVRLTRAYRATENFAAEISHIDLTGEVLIELADQAFVETHVGDAPGELRSADLVELASDQPGKIIIEVSAARPSIIVVNESYHCGWTAVGREFGPTPRPLHVLRINGDFLGCLVPQGRSTVEFRFAPDSLRYGRLISVCSLGLLVILAAAATWRRAVSALRPEPMPRFRAY